MRLVSPSGRGAPLNLVDLAMRSSGRDMWLLDGPRRAGRGRAAFTDCHPRRQTRLLAGDLQPAQTRRLLPPSPAIDAPGRDSHGKPWDRLPFWQRARGAYDALKALRNVAAEQAVLRKDGAVETVRL